MTPTLLFASLLARFVLGNTGAGDDLAAIDEKLRSPNARDRVEAPHAAAKIGNAEALRRIVAHLGDHNIYVADHAMAAFSEVTDARAVEAAARDAWKIDDDETRKGVLDALLKSKADFSADVVVPRLAAGDPEEKRLALELLEKRKPSSLPKEVAKLASAAEKDAGVRASALIALAALDPAAAAPAIAAAQKEKNATLRVGALLAVEAAKGPLDETAVAALADPDRRVRLTALAIVERDRPVLAVPKLIARIPLEGGRVRERVVLALRAISGRDFADDDKAWAKWWGEAGPTFKPPPPSVGAKRGKPADASATRLETRADLPKYYELAVASDRVAFLVDISGSMRETYTAPGETGAAAGSKSRHEHAAATLRDTLKQLKKGTKASVIVFSDAPVRWRDGGKGGATSVEPTPKMADDVFKFVMALTPQKSTNIFDALDLVLDDADVDAVYLLSDGAPSAGRIILPSRLIAQTRRTARFSRVEVNTISLGADAAGERLLRDLAEATGGQFSKR